MDKKQVIISKARLLKSISHPIRLCLVKKLVEHNTCNVSYFTDCMDASQSNISQHLAKLRDLGIIACVRDGKNINYYLKNNEVRNIINTIFKEEENV